MKLERLLTLKTMEQFLLHQRKPREQKKQTINKIIDETGATIDIEDDGTVFITSEKAEGAEKAIAWVKDLTREAKVGENFGAFIEILPGQEGLLHISELSGKEKVENIESVIHRGDTITVRVKNIDDSGKISLSLFKKGVAM